MDFIRDLYEKEKNGGNPMVGKTYGYGYSNNNYNRKPQPEGKEVWEIDGKEYPVTKYSNGVYLYRPFSALVMGDLDGTQVYSKEQLAKKIRNDEWVKNYLANERREFVKGIPFVGDNILNAYDNASAGIRNFGNNIKRLMPK